MIKNVIQENKGQAVAEFGLSLLILLPLIFWILNFAELLNVRHKITEMTRFSAWEKAYGRTDHDIEERVKNTLNHSSLFSSSNNSVTIKRKIKSTQHDFYTLSLGHNNSPIGRRMIYSLGLNEDNHYIYTVECDEKLPFEHHVTLSGHYSIISDSWHLTDKSSNNKIDNKDLEYHVYRIFFWPLFNLEIKKFLDIFDKFQYNRWVQELVNLVGQKLDINPRGHPTLDHVPSPWP